MNKPSSIVLGSGHGSHRKKALHASNHDLKNFDYGQLHSTQVSSVVETTDKASRKSGIAFDRRGATQATTSLLA
jgi:hypothetical protein